MYILADENVETEWVRALIDDGHDVSRVVDTPTLGESAPDTAVLDFAITRNQVLLTADQTDFSVPPRDEHPGLIIITDVGLSGGQLRRAIRRIAV